MFEIKLTKVGDRHQFYHQYSAIAINLGKVNLWQFRSNLVSENTEKKFQHVSYKDVGLQA